MSDKPRAFTCPRCRFVSHNPNDAKHRYCVRCHWFVDEPRTVEELAVVLGLEALTPEQRQRVLDELRRRLKQPSRVQGGDSGGDSNPAPARQA